MILKNIFNFFFIFVVFCASLAVRADENWLKALDAVGKRDFAEAQGQLAKQSNKGYGSYRLLGALHEKNKEYPQALIAYRRSQQQVGVTTFFDAILNVIRVKKELGHEINIFYEFFLTLCFLLWALFFQILFLLGLVLFVVQLRSQKKDFALVVLALCLVSFGFIGYCIVCNVNQQDRAVVIDKGDLRIGPDSIYQMQKPLAAGDEIVLAPKNVVDNWYKSVSDGVVGWISGDLLEKI